MFSCAFFKKDISGKKKGNREESYYCNRCRHRMTFIPQHLKACSEANSAFQNIIIAIKMTIPIFKANTYICFLMLKSCFYKFIHWITSSYPLPSFCFESFTLADNLLNILNVEDAYTYTKRQKSNNCTPIYLCSDVTHKMLLSSC